MSGKRCFVLAAALSAFALSACQSPLGDSGGRTIPDLGRAVYLLNNLAETVSVYDPDSGAMYVNNADGTPIIATGQVPNDISYYDGRLFIVNSMDNDVQVVRESDYAPLKTVYLGKNRNPYSIIIDPLFGRAFVPNFLAGTVTVIDLSSYAILAEIGVGVGPEGGCYMDGKVYVANTGYYDETFGEGSVSVIDASSADSSSLAVVGTITVGAGSNPQSILPLPDLNQVHIVCSGNNDGSEDADGKIVAIDAADPAFGIIDELAIGGSPLVSGDGYDSASGRVYLGGTGGLMTYAAGASPAVEHGSTDFFYDANALVSAAAYDPVDDLVYALDFSASRLLLIDSAGALTRSVSTGDGPIAMALFSK